MTELTEFYKKLRKVDSGNRITVYYEHLSVLGAAFFDTTLEITIRTEIGRVIFDKKIPLFYSSLTKMLQDKEWDARRWAALFLFKRWNEVHLLDDPDWRCRKYGEFLQTRPRIQAMYGGVPRFILHGSD